MREDILSLVPPVSRREFAVTTLAAGFAVATGPVAAQTITTDTTGLTAGEVKAESTGLVFAEKEPLGYVSDHTGLLARLSLTPDTIGGRYGASSRA